MLASLLTLAAVMVAFPKAGQVLPPLERCYMIGSAEPGTLNVWVQGKIVPVHEMGGWVTMVDLVEGSNTVMVANTNVTFFVSPRPKPTLKPVKEKVYEKLAYAADAPKPHPASVSNRTDALTIVLDPGHGGPDTGALSPHGIGEKDANLRMAKAVRAELAKRGFKVVMTREDDTFVPLYDRPKVAHANDAVAFVSIHHNAPPFDKDPRAFRYTAVYAWNEIGETLAKAINGKMAATLAEEGLKNNGVPHANFAVMRNPEIPSCLIEVDFISTPEGELSCWDRERRTRVAASIADGISDWALTPPDAPIREIPAE